jgi:hypothetical protein
MFKLELNDHERNVLIEALQSFLSELDDEIGHTDRFDFRQQLKAQAGELQEIINRLN